MALRGHTERAEQPAAQARQQRTSDTQAIETVLDAERAAERAVTEAEAEAERILSEARDHARRIGERADERIRRVHARSAALSDSAVEELYAAHEDRARESQQSLSDPGRVDRAAARVAAWLLGEDEA